MHYYRSRLDLRSRTEMNPEVDYSAEPQVSAAVRLRDKKKSGEVMDVAVPATPLVTTREVIIAAEDGTLRALTRDLKTQVWRRRFSSRFYSSPIFVPGMDTFLIASYSGDVHAVDLGGELRWSRALGHRVYGSPAIVVEQNRVYVPSAGHLLWGLNLQSGELVWEARLPAPWFSEAALVGGKDPYSSISLTLEGEAVLGAGEFVVCLDTEGREKWRLDTGAAIRATPALDFERGSGVVANTAGRVLQFSLAGGSIQADHRLPSKVLASPALSEGHAAFACENGELALWNLQTRKLQWTIPAGAGTGHNAVHSFPDGSGFSYLNCRGNLSAVSLDGEFLWESSQVIDVPFQNPRLETTPVMTGDGYMYATSYSGFVYRFSFRRRKCKSN